MFYDQAEYNIRCEWGAAGIANLAPLCDVVIVVDVLSFSTCVDVAVGRGAEVYPFVWNGEDVESFAKRVGAVVASSRREEIGRFTLSPSSLLTIEPRTKLVLPSPNGSTLSWMTGDKVTFAGCLRNARAVAKSALEAGKNILLIPAGEKWADGTLRPAIEDLIGAGAIISYLAEERSVSPEARTALNAYDMAVGDMYTVLKGCSSGRELIERGFEEDVTLAGELNCSSVTPRLVEGSYRASLASNR